MQGSFTKGLILGSIIGASMGRIMENRGNSSSRRKMVRNGRNILKKSGSLIEDIVDLLR